MCKCVRTINNLLKQDSDDLDAAIDCIDNLPRFTASFSQIKADGTCEKVKTTLPIIPKFCPFCGKKY